MNYRLRLEAKVRAVNAVHAYYNANCDRIREAFTPMVGRKALLATGQPSKEFREVEKSLALPYANLGISVSRNFSRYSLSFCIDSNMLTTDGNCCVRYGIQLYVANVEGVTITSLIPENNKPLRCDYDLAWVDERRARFDEHRKLADSIRSELFAFGVDDYSL